LNTPVRKNGLNATTVGKSGQSDAKNFSRKHSDGSPRISCGCVPMPCSRPEQVVCVATEITLVRALEASVLATSLLMLSLVAANLVLISFGALNS
jgi:hypothetical protein